MIQKMIDFIERYSSLSSTERELILSANKVKAFKKNHVLRSFHDTDDSSFFVLSGSLYSSVLVDGEEAVGDFYFEGEPVIVPSFSSDKQNPYQLVCLEDCQIAVGDSSQTERLLLEHPNFERVCRLFAEERLNTYYSFHNSLKNLSAAKSYELLKEQRPRLIDEVPHFLLASYLGMSPETLSRVRNKKSLEN